MFGPIHTVIFDFDGTLVDTMGSVVKGFQSIISKHLGRSVERAELLATFGPAPLDVFRHWLAGELEGEKKVSEAYQEWTQLETHLGPQSYEPFVGVPEMLSQLRDARVEIGIFTGRDRASTLKIARRHNWLSRFFKDEHMVCGDDGLATKPHPAALNHLQKVMGFDPTTTLMVGDHVYDMLAGRAAGCKTGAALWDMPGADTGTQRSRFRNTWQNWDQVDVDVRLDSPLSLARWVIKPSTAQ